MSPALLPVTRAVAVVALALATLLTVSVAAAPGSSLLAPGTADAGPPEDHPGPETTFYGYSSESYFDAYYSSLLSNVTSYELQFGVRCVPRGGYEIVAIGDSDYNWGATATLNFFQVRAHYDCA
jgi:hypothetical protein